MKKFVEIFKKIIVCIVIVFISITICMRSELKPFFKRYPTIDSDVYIYIGQELNNGKVMYKDIFDHKGPLFHFIEYIGVKLSFYWYEGVWIIEIISMIVFFSFIYKTSNLITKNKLLSILVIFTSAIPLSLFFINGNYPEEYSLPFVGIGLYYMIKYIVSKKEMDLKTGLLIGASFGCVTIIKLNLVSVWVIFVLAIWGMQIYNKKWNELKKSILYMGIGALIPILIAIIVLLIQQNLIDCFKQYILFNFKYATNEEGSLEVTIKTFASKVFLLSLFACVIDFIYRIVLKKEDKKISVLSLIYAIFSFLILIMPLNAYNHYGMILTPTYVIPLSLLIKDFFELIKSDESKIIFALGFIIVFCLTFYITRRDIVTLEKDLICATLERTAVKENDFTKYIEENTTEDDNILMLGNDCNVYLRTNRSSECKYVYHIPISRIDPNIMKETIEEIKKHKPKIIALRVTEYVEVQNYFYKYLDEENAYEKVEEFSNYEVYLRKDI